ncbi:hypothetical protein BB560_006505, partial [Smittium megazygosporum]
MTVQQPEKFEPHLGMGAVKWIECKIQKLKQQDFKYITNLEVELQELFIKAKIDDERIELNCLLNFLEPRYYQKLHQTKFEAPEIEPETYLTQATPTNKKAIRMVGEQAEIDSGGKACIASNLEFSSVSLWNSTGIVRSLLILVPSPSFVSDS